MLEAPTSIDVDVRRILTHLQLPNDGVRFLDVKARGNAVQLECFENVRLTIEERGGRSVHGWLVWRWPRVFVEAEFHCVWQSEDGDLHDVTPRPDGDMRVLFVADPSRTYEGRSLDNVRIPLRDDKLVRDFIRLAEMRFELMNRGDRAVQHGLVSVPAAEYEHIAQGMGFIEGMLCEGLTQHSRCACGSGLKYRKCHGKVL